MGGKAVALELWATAGSPTLALRPSTHPAHHAFPTGSLACIRHANKPMPMDISQLVILTPGPVCLYSSCTLAFCSLLYSPGVVDQLFHKILFELRLGQDIVGLPLSPGVS